MIITMPSYCLRRDRFRAQAVLYGNDFSLTDHDYGAAGIYKSVRGRDPSLFMRIIFRHSRTGNSITPRQGPAASQQNNEIKRSNAAQCCMQRCQGGCAAEIAAPTAREEAR